MAIKCNSFEDVVEIRLNEIRLVDVLVNGENVEFTETDNIDLKGINLIEILEISNEFHKHR